MHRRSSGLTLIELLTSLVIVGIMASILLPSIAASRESARNAQCKNNLRQLGLAALQFERNNQHLPPGLEQELFPNAPVYRGSSLFVHMLPFIEVVSLINRWDFDDPLRNTEGGRQSRTAQVVPILVCPSDRIPANPIQQQGWFYAITSYGGNGGKRSYMPAQSTTDGLFHTTGSASEPQPHQEKVRLNAILDGMSKTFMLGERSHIDRNMEEFAASNWTESLSKVGWWAPSGGRRAIGHVTMSATVPINYRISYSPAEVASQTSGKTSINFQADIERRWCAWGSAHASGANFCYADGSIHFIDEQIDFEVLQSLSTRTGND